MGRMILQKILTGLIIIQISFGSSFFLPSIIAKAATGVPNIISYQGQLADSSGNLLGGTLGTAYYFKFSIYDNATVGSGTKLWPAGAPTATSTLVVSGNFNFNIGDTDTGYPDALTYNFQDNKNVFLQVEVSSDNITYETLAPRQRITSAGFAINAGNVLGWNPSNNLWLTGNNPQINATSTNALVLQGASTGDILFFSSSTKITSGGNLTLAGTLSVASSTTFRGVTYSWPSGQGGANTILTNDGSGVLTWGAAGGSGGTATSWHLLSNPTSTLSLSMASNTTAFTWNAGTAAQNLFTLQDTTGNTGTGVLLNLITSVGSSLNPFRVTASGTVALAVNPFGKVSVGTTTADTSLYVSGSFRATASSTFNSAGASKIGYLDSGSVLTGLNIGTGLSASGDTLSASGVADGNDPFKWIASGANLYSSSTYTKLGIGNLSPSSTLHITGDLYVTGSSTLTGSTTLSNISSGIIKSNSSGLLTSGSVSLTTEVSGLLPTASGGTATSTTPVSNKFLVGNGTLFEYLGLSAGTNISVSKLDGNFQISNTLASDGNDPFKWIANGTDLYSSSTYTKLGVGTTAPSSTLHVVGTFRSSATTTLDSSLVVDTNTLYIEAGDNRVGIGTTAPSSTLHVVGSQMITPLLPTSDKLLSFVNTGNTHGFTALAPSNVYGQILFGNTSDAGLNIRGFSDSTSIKALVLDGFQDITSQNSQPAILLSGHSRSGTGSAALSSGSTVFRIDNDGSNPVVLMGSGNFGIGTATPTSTLHISGTNTSTLSIANTLTGGKIYQIRVGALASGTLDLYDNTSSTSRFAINSSGVTAIAGSLNASSALSVTGATSLGSALQVTGPSSLTTLSVSASTTFNSVGTSKILYLDGNSIVSGINIGTGLSLSGDTLSVSFSNDGNDPFKWIAGTVSGNTVLYSSSTYTKLGIGTATPSTTLDITGDFRVATGTVSLTLNQSGTSIVGALRASSTLSVTGQTSLGSEIQVTGPASLLSTLSVSATSTFSGQVGIGTTAPSSTLHVVGTFQVSGTSTFQGPTYIADLYGGSNIFANDSGQVTWIDMAVSSDVATSTVESITANLAGNPLLTLYGEAAGGLGGVTTSTLRVGINTLFPSSTLHVVGTAQVTGVSTLSGLTFTNATGTGNLQITSLYATGSSTISGSTTLSNLSSGIVKSSAGGLLTAGQVSLTSEISGILPLANGGTATSTTPVSNKFLVGNGTLFEYLGLSAGSNVIIQKLDGNLQITVPTNGNDPFKWIANGTDLYSSSTYTKLGIGTTAPSSTLHVVGTFRSSATTTLDSSLVVDTNTLYVEAGDNRVGIGTTTPSTTLTVVGTFSVTATSTLAGATFSGITHMGSGTAKWSLGSNPNDNYRFTLSQGATLGTNNALLVTTSTRNIAIPNSLIVGTDNTPSSTLHVVGSLYVTGSSTLTGSTTLSNLSYGIVKSSSAGLLTAGQVSLTSEISGILPLANGGTATSTTPVSNKFLVGNGTLFEYLGLSAGSNVIIEKLDGNLQITVPTNGNDPFKWIANGTDLYSSSTYTKLGIGTTAPSSTLHVVGTFRSSATTTLDSSLVVDTNTLYVEAGDNRVGIGTTTPSSTLHVVGTFQVNGTSTLQGQTTIENIILGAATFDTDAGMVTWMDMAVTSASAVDTVESYTAKIDGLDILTIYSQSDGAGGIKNGGVAVGTSTAYGLFTVASSSNIYFNIASSTGYATFNAAILASSTLQVTGVSTLTGLTFTNATGTTLSVTTALNSSGTLAVTGASTFAGAIQASSTLQVTGATSLGAALQVTGPASLLSTLSVSATSTFSGQVGIGTNAPSSTLHVVGTFQVTGTSTFSGPVIMDDFNAGTLTFDSNAGQVTWIDMPVTSDATIGTIESYTAAIDGNALLTLWSESNGAGGLRNSGVAVGTSTAYGLFTVASSSNIYFNIASSTGYATFNAALLASSTLQVTGVSTLSGLTFTNATGTGNLQIASLYVTGSSTLTASTTIPSLGVSKLVYSGTGSTLQGINVGSGLSLSGDTLSVSVTSDGNDPFKWIANGTDLYASSTYTKIGIGTIVPSSTLHVVGTLRASATTTLDSSLVVDTNTLYVQADVDRVGIGTTVPSSTLHVIGTFQVSGTSTLSGPTYIDDLNLGLTTFDANAGIVTWIDLPVTSAATAGTVQSYIAKIDDNDLLTIYSESDGSGGIRQAGVAVGTSTAYGLFTVASSSNIYFNIASSTGNVSVKNTLNVSSTLYVTGVSTLGGLNFTNATGTTLSVTTALNSSGTLAVTGASTFAGAIQASSTLQVTGATSLGAALQVTGPASLLSTLSVTATTTLSNSLVVDTNTLYVEAGDNRVGIGTLTPSSSLHVVGTFQVTGTSTFSGPTTIDDLNLGNLTYGADSGLITWIDMPVTSDAIAGTVEAYKVNIDGNTLLTVYSESDGAGGIKNGGVAVGTSTAYGLFTVASSSNVYFNIASSTGNVGIATTAPSSTLHVVGTFQVTGTSTLQGPTIIDNFQAGAFAFDDDGGQVSWFDMAVTSNAAVNTVESYTAQLDGNPILTIYSQSDGSGGIKNGGVAVGTSTAYGLFTVASSSNIYFNIASSTGDITVKNTLNVSSTLYVTGVSTLSGLTFTNATGTTLSVTTALNSSGTLAVTGASTFAGALQASSTLQVTGATSLGSALQVTGPASLLSTLSVSATSTLAGLVANNLTIGTTLLVATSSQIGIGTNAPSSTLHVVGTFQVTGTSTFSGPTTIDDLILGASTFDTDAGILSWADMPVTSNSTTSAKMSYSAQLDGNILLTIYGESNGAGGTQNLGVAVGTSTTNGYNFFVNASGTTVAAFNRDTDDGTIISIQQGGAEEGTISVSGATISYNAFTGSHYALMNNDDEEVTKGDVMVMTGNNTRLRNSKDSEILYGIEKSTKANSPAVLGSYLAVQEPSKPQSIKNPVLVMASGNGDVLVVDNGEDIMVGDYLITSDVAGHAMKDLRKDNESYVFARASEEIRWTDVTDLVGEVKHKKITVFYESFVRDNTTAIANMLQKAGNVASIPVDANITVKTISITGDLVVGGTATIKQVIADAIQAKTLCLEDICITRDQLKELLEKNGLIGTQMNTDTAPINTDNTTSTPAEPTPVETASIIDAVTPSSTPPEPVVEPAPEPVPPTSAVSEQAEPAPVVEPVAEPVAELTP